MKAPQIGTTGVDFPDDQLTDYFSRFNSIEVAISGQTDARRLAALTEAVPTSGSISVVAPSGALFDEDTAALDRFYQLIAPLEDRLGAVLHLVPDDFEYSPTKLALQLDRLPEGYRHVLQFRDSEWYKERLRNLLEERDLVFCLHDLTGHVSPEWVTGKFLYVRQHADSYTSDEIQQMGSRLARHLDRKRPIFSYFVGSQGHDATDAASQLTQRLDQP